MDLSELGSLNCKGYMPNSDVLRDSRGRSPSAQRNANKQERRSKPGSGTAQRDRHRDKRRSSASRRKKRRQAKDRGLWYAGAHGDTENIRKSTFDREMEQGTLVEYDDVSSQSEKFSGSPSPKLDPRLSMDRLSDVDFGEYNGPVSPNRSHLRDREVACLNRGEHTRGPSERSKRDRETGKKKDSHSRDRDSSKVRSGGGGSKNHKESTRSSDRNGKRTSSSQSGTDKRDSKRHRSNTRTDKETPSAYRNAPQSYRDDREDLRGYRRSPGLKGDSPYGTSYPYSYQSPGGYNQQISRRSPISYGSKRHSPSSTYYSRDVDVYGSYGMPKSPSSYSSNKRKRSPGSPGWRRSPSYNRHSPLEQGEFASSPYGNRRRSQSPYRKSPSPDIR